MRENEESLEKVSAHLQLVTNNIMEFGNVLNSGIDSVVSLKENFEENGENLSEKLDELLEKLEEVSITVIEVSKKQSTQLKTLSNVESKLSSIASHTTPSEGALKSKAEETTTPWLRVNHWKGFVSVIGGLFFIQIMVTYAFLSIDSMRVSSDVFNTYQFGRRVLEIWPKLDAKDREKMIKLAVKG